ncbi:MAG: hypothetical protein HRT71_01255 [Flavobacteriales bacterium]|nr:hypothetical protein [Flavobacteriales bacterium]
MSGYFSKLLVVLAVCLFASCGEPKNEKIDLSDYNSSSSIEIDTEKNGLQIEWQSGDDTQFRIDFNLSGIDPLINTISFATEGSSTFTPLAEKIQPDFQTTVGIRGSKYDSNWPWIFFDNPTKRESITSSSVIDLTNVKVESSEGRVSITFSKITSGAFYGDLVCNIYTGSPLIYWEAVMTTDQPKVAYLYDTEFHTKIPKVAYEDYKTSNLDVVVPADTLTNYKVKYRTLMVDYPNGTMAIFPPPHAYFWAANMPAPNIGYLRASKESIGTRQARKLDHSYNAWIDAPVGKYQRMGVFQFLSPTDAKSTLEKIKQYTHGDQFKILDGYKTYTTHYHPRITRYELEGDFHYPEEFKKVMKGINVQIVHLAEFHCCGDWNGRDLGEARLLQLKGMFDLTQKYSDNEFAFLPGEEASVSWGGHWTYIFPKPVYFIKRREKGKPFKETVEGFGTVYHLSDDESVYNMFKEEKGLAFTAHPRIKGSKNYPDKYAHKDFFLDDDVFAGVEWKSVPTDLSQPRLGERVFQLQDEMNQWGVKKKMVGAGDLFYLDSTSSIYSQMNISYLKLDKVPDPINYPEVLDVIKKGDLWLTTGEVLLLSHSITESEVTAEIEWTFPLQFAEVIYNDGDQIKRHNISLTKTKEHGKQKFTFPVDLSNATWARFEVWDIARNGAWTQTTWLKEPVKRAIGISGFTLINADTDYPIDGFEPMQEGSVISYQALPTKNINIRINPSPYTIDSLEVDFDGNVTWDTQGVYPYSVWDEADGDYEAFTPAAGEHTLKVTAYRNGQKGIPFTINFTLTE